MSEQPKPKKDKPLSDRGTPLIYTDTLMEIFDFDEHAIMTNERGDITEAQKHIITGVLQEEADSMWLMMSIFIGTSILLGLIFSFQGYAPLPLVIGAGTVIGGLLAIAYFRQTKFTRDTAQGHSYHVEGLPRIRATISGDKQAELLIADQKLPISYQQAAALSEFALPIMRIYYATNSKQILSAEVLDNEEVYKLKNEDLIEDEELMVYAERELDDEQSTMQQK